MRWSECSTPDDRSGIDEIRPAYLWELVAKVRLPGIDAKFHVMGPSSVIDDRIRSY